MDSVGDSRGDTGKADLADTAGAEWVQVVVRIVEEGDVNVGCVGIDGYNVVGEVAVDGSACTLIVLGGLEHAHADAHYDGALNLVARGAWIQHAARIDDGDDTAHPQARDLGLPADFGELRAVAVGRVLPGWVAKGTLRFASTGDCLDIGDPENFGKRESPFRLPLQTDLAVDKLEIFGLLSLKGRTCRADRDYEQCLGSLLSSLQHCGRDRGSGPGAAGNGAGRQR